MQKQVEATPWDDGKITEFMKVATGQAYDTPAGHTLLFFATSHEKGAEIAAEIERLLSWLGVTRAFRIHLWWRDDPRELYDIAWPSRREVNGGWTTPGTSSIYVYRSEEWDRVVLHEMIHALEWDWKMPTRALPCWGLGDSAKVVPALFEAWTELLAEWLWCGWHADPTDTTAEAWHIQRKWQDAQAIQILARAQNKTWDENTSVFAYYVLKAALAPHFPFLWMHRNGDSSEDRTRLLCELASPSLTVLREKAQQTLPTNISMRMTAPLFTKSQ